MYVAQNGIIEGITAVKVELNKYGSYDYKMSNKKKYRDIDFNNIIFCDFEKCKKTYEIRFKIKKKNQLLKEYEKELNKMLGIEWHSTVKIK